MTKLVLVARIILGLIYFVFGLNGFFHFIPLPEMPERAVNFMGALAASGFFLPFLKLTEIVCGLLLLIGRFVPLALTILAPVVINIVLFHLFLEPAGSLLGVVSLILLLYLAYAYRGSFSGVLNASAQPG